MGRFEMGIDEVFGSFEGDKKEGALLFKTKG